MDDSVTYVIDRLGHHGDGIAAGPVYAPRTLPGEVVTGTCDGDRLQDVRIITPAETRVRPGCRHYKSCGGCDLQHASDGFVSDWKQGFVVSALADRGLNPEFRPLQTSPPQSRRRASVAARRTKGGAMAGFHTRRSDVITPVPDCQALHPQLTGALPGAEALAQAGTSRKTPLVVTMTVTAHGPDVAVANGKPLDGPLRQGLAGIAAEHGFSRLTWDGETVVTRLPPEQQFDGITVIPPAGAFLQATLAGQEALIAGVRDAVGDAGRIIDLFAGCGTFALPLTRGAQVHAVEGEAQMLEAAMAGWRGTSGLRQFTTERRDLFRNPILAPDLGGYEAAVIDPPRAGAAAQVAQLAESGIGTIAYVSCNPVSFAADAAVLCAAGYVLDWVQVVDQFRWSMHTELVSAFRLANS